MLPRTQLLEQLFEQIDIEWWEGPTAPPALEPSDREALLVLADEWTATGAPEGPALAYILANENDPSVFLWDPAKPPFEFEARATPNAEAYLAWLQELLVKQPLRDVVGRGLWEMMRAIERRELAVVSCVHDVFLLGNGWKFEVVFRWGGYYRTRYVSAPSGHCVRVSGFPEGTRLGDFAEYEPDDATQAEVFAPLRGGLE